MAHQLRDGSVVEDLRLDRLVEFDERSRQFPVTARLTADQTTPITKAWNCSIVMDQGTEGSCVGHGFGHEAAADPVPVPDMTHKYARETIYWGTQKIDQWPGGAYPGAKPQYEGTSVLTGAKWMQKHGFYTAYHWAFGEPDVALAISYLGPVVLGLNWYNNMSTPNKQGFLKPTGGLAGGHCILANAYNAEGKYYTLHNSWGPSWGNNGEAKIAAADLAKLLTKQQQGEACIPETRLNVVI